MKRKWWEKVPLLMTEEQYRLLWIATGCYLAGSIGLWLIYGAFLYLTGRA